MTRDFTRQELQAIREKAEAQIRAPWTRNPHWIRAYSSLAAAADALDAIIARTEVCEDTSSGEMSSLWDDVVKALSPLYERYCAEGVTSEAGIINPKLEEDLCNLIEAYDAFLD